MSPSVDVLRTTRVGDIAMAVSGGGSGDRSWIDLEFEDDLDEAQARQMIRETAQRVSGEWREALRKVGLAGAQARAYEAAFVNDQTELALTL
jgi:serine/threonine-protein kinase HipA